MRQTAGEACRAVCDRGEAESVQVPLGFAAVAQGCVSGVPRLFVVEGGADARRHAAAFGTGGGFPRGGGDGGGGVNS